MITEVIMLAVGAAVLSAGVVGLMRRFALARGLMDVPNERSSHMVPTPRGGGVGIVVGASISIAILFLSGLVEAPLAIALCGGGVAVAVTGYLDDCKSLPVWQRLGVHLIVAAATSLLLGGLPAVQLGTTLIKPGAWGHVVTVVGIVWVLNLFNFMDGIDAIAGSEAVFITLAGGVLTSMCGPNGGTTFCAVIIGASTLGFLIWNWPPARIFLGDVGSGYLGFVIACLAIASSQEYPATPFVWLILGGVFFADATCTLFLRLCRGETVYLAHRTHAYQRLAQRWGSHLWVTLVIIGVDILWLLPLATRAQSHPEQASWMALIALTPLLLLVIALSRERLVKKS